MTAREKIIQATLATLAEAGATGTPVDRIASRAGCAKGLVNYHFHTKVELFAEAARVLGGGRREARFHAVQGHRGAEALDALWQTLVDDAASNRSRAWLTLLAEAAASADLTRAEGPGDDLLREIAAALESPADAWEPTLVIAVLDGLEIALLRGRPPERVREAYDRFWLVLLRELEELRP